MKGRPSKSRAAKPAGPAYDRPASPTAPPVLSDDSKWKIEVNDRYQRVIDLLIGLATGSLVLPPFFLKDFLGVKEEPIAIFLDAWAYGSIGAFAAAIGLGILFHYVSAKWVKRAYGQPVRYLGEHFEGLLEWLFWLVIACFAGGLACFGWFVMHS